MEKVTKEQVNAAIVALRAAKIEAAEVAGRIKDAEDIVEAFGIDNVGSFADGRLAMETGVIAIKAGAAKPIKEGKPLSTAARSELAAALPPLYVKVACDFGVLYDSKDKTVRQILKARGVEIVKDDKYVIL